MKKYGGYNDQFNGSGESTKTLFNSALASLERLHMWLKYSGMFSLDQNYISWKLALDNVENEIYYKLTLEEVKGNKPLKDHINKVFVGMHDYAKRKKIDISNVSSPLPTLLPIYEKQLRSLADAHGMLIPDKPSPMEFM